ncbi:MAG: lytic transglycosylase domain-containing protein [Clostridia bacterium]|nr:lytic transglycosylase domain-containing protein [Clostridia bacterium]
MILFLFPIKYRHQVEYFSEKYGLSESLVASVINIESRYDKKAISEVGAKGLMQIMDSTADECIRKLGIAETWDIFDVEDNMEVGCFYLKYLLDIFEGNVINALCAYNWGLGNVRSWIDAGNCDVAGNITNIPVNETANYIKKYKVCYWVYSKIYNYNVEA